MDTWEATIIIVAIATALTIYRLADQIVLWVYPLVWKLL